jgi:hypothetical protein
MVHLVTNVMENLLAMIALTNPKLDAAVAMDTQPAIKWGRVIPLQKVVALGNTRAMQLGLTLLLG